MASRFEGLELLMAETGVAIAAARAEAVAALAALMAERTARDPLSPFPAAALALEGALEADLERLPAVDVEDTYIQRLRAGRERDRAAGRTLDGPHRSDLLVAHAPKAMPARLCSTGEQKALLIGLDSGPRRARLRAAATARRSCCSTRSRRISTPSGARRCSRRSCGSARRHG